MKNHFEQRPLIFFTAVFALTSGFLYCFGEQRFGLAALLVTVIALSAATVPAIMFVRRRRSCFAIITLVIMGAPLAALFMSRNAGAERYALSLQGQSVTAQGRVYFVNNDGKTQIVRMRANVINGQKVPEFGILVNVTGDCPDMYDSVTMQLDARQLDTGFYDGGYRTIFRGDGVFMSGLGQMLEREEPPFYYAFLKSLRKTVRRSFDYTDCPALLSTLLLGDRSQLKDADYILFARAGIAHLLALSGLHVAIIILWLDTVVSLFTPNRRLLAIFSALFAVFYMALTGFTPSVSRACFMTLFTLGASLFGRRSDGLNGLCLALLIVLFKNPYCIGSASLQLSFCATLGIVTAGGPLSERAKNFICAKLSETTPYILKFLANFAAAFASSVIITFFVTLFTLPTSFLRYGSITIVSLLSNFVAVPITTVIIFCALAYIITFLFPVSRELAIMGLNDVLGLLKESLYGSAEFLAGLGVPQISVPAGRRWIISVATAVLLLILVLKNVRPRGYCAAPVLVALLLTATALWPGNDADYVIHCLRSAQSQSVIFSHNGQAIAYRGTGTSYSITQFCLEYRIQTLDDLIIPMPYDGLIYYLDQFYDEGYGLKRLWIEKSAVTQELKDYLAKKGTELKEFGYFERFGNFWADFEVRPVDSGCHSLHAKVGQTDFIYSFNTEPHYRIFAPECDIEMAGGVVCFDDPENKNRPKYFIYGFKTDNERLKNNMQNSSVYDLYGAAVHEFFIKDQTITMRSTG